MIKIIFDYILEFIKVLSLASIPALIFYFRKPLTSLARAFSDAESIKWGKRGEYKRRKEEINKILDHLQPEDKKILDHLQPEDKKVLDHLQPEGEKIQILSKILKIKDEIILRTENKFLLMTNIALSLSFVEDIPQLTKRLKGYRDTEYKNIKSIDPDSETIAFCDSIISEGLVPPMEESQQSQP